LYGWVVANSAIAFIRKQIATRMRAKPPHQQLSGRAILAMTALAIVLGGCRTTRLYLKPESWSERIQASPQLGSSQTGLLVYDPIRDDVVASHLADHWFTPASNIKILTALAGLLILGDTATALYTGRQGDTIYFSGAADPSLLHPAFPYQPAMEELSVPGLVPVYCPRHLEGGRFGAGWAWDDYSAYFSPERAAMPVYGNVVRFQGWNDAGNIGIIPRFFEACTELLPDSGFSGEPVRRLEFQNQFKVWRQTGTEELRQEVPFLHSDSLLCRLLADTLGKKVYRRQPPPQISWAVVPGQPVDSLIRPMLRDSDNFMAEQLLLMCADRLYDSLDAGRAIGWMLNGPLSGLRASLKWVDGSGLSRYNQASPRALASALLKILEYLPQERLLRLFPGIRTETGTEDTWLYAKSGGMQQVYNLSGYLIARSGRVLIFSFMNNHSSYGRAELHTSMIHILTEIRERY
jgi:serine-type D-Ala-D-Ala carboxypeptidase/endopeptidase (penicillin-binding protein 4)